MSNLAIALALIGVAAACAYCSVEMNRSSAGKDRFEIETCVKQGGLWRTDGWSRPYCYFADLSRGESQ